MDLSDFKPFTMVSGKSFVTISKSGVSFSQAAIVELEKPEFVVVLFNTAKKQMAIKIADKNDADATVFLKRNRHNLSVRWNNSLLKEKISRMMDWNLQENTYRVDGNYDSVSKVLLFDLSSAQENKK